MDDISNNSKNNAQRDDSQKKEVRTMRARSRTVLLSPELTGEVRAQVNNEESGDITTGFARITSQELGGGQFGRKTEGNRFVTVSDNKIDDSIKVTGVKNNNRMPTTMATPRPHFSGFNPSMSNDDAEEEIVSSNPARTVPSYAPENNSRNNGYVDSRQPSYKKEESYVDNKFSNPTHDCVVYEKSSPIVGFLVSYDNNENGEVLELRVGRLIITSETSGHGNFVYLNDSSVSPMHAILRVAKGSDIQVLDQLSEFGTKITKASDKKVIELSGEKGVIGHGDKISFGERTFEVCLLSA